MGRLGHDVTVVCYAHGLDHVDSEYQIVRTPRVPAYGNMRAGPDLVKPFLDLALAYKVASIPADIVHAHNYEAPIAAALARRYTGTPIVYNAHNTMVEELPTYFDGRMGRRLARSVGRWLDGRVPALADHAVVLTPRVVDTLSVLGCESVSLIPPGVDATDLDDVPPACLPEGPWVIYAGNPDRYQDLDVLVEAIRKLDGVGLLMVSASPLDDGFAEGLPKFMAIQTSNFNEVKSLMAASDIAAIPRTVCSGFPIKLLNTLGMGLPTVVAEGSAQDYPEKFRYKMAIRMQWLRQFLAAKRPASVQ